MTVATSTASTRRRPSSSSSTSSSRTRPSASRALVGTDRHSELEQSKADLRTFERRRAAVEEREADEERDKLNPLVRSLFPSTREDGEDVAWVTDTLPPAIVDDVAEPETRLPDKWLADFAARALPTLAKLQRAYAPLEPLEALLPERRS